MIRGCLATTVCLVSAAMAQESLGARIDALAKEIEPKVVDWRRDIHQFPELGNREFRTSKLVAKHLKSLGMKVQTEVAHTGVVGVLEGGKRGPVILLRADMDALPVVEMVELPFRSREKAEYNGQQVGVMHACGHDNHVAILMGVAEIFTKLKPDLPGTIKFVFQPAEEGAPEGEEGGADLMIKEGVMENPAPEAAFGLHVTQGFAVGEAGVRAGGAMASSDEIKIVVKGRQTHAAQPWAGVDPVVAAAHVVVALQTVVSRHADITNAPAIVSISMIHGGVRNNIIPDDVELAGTIRTLDPEMREQIHERVRLIAEQTAAAHGAKAEVTINLGYPVTVNDPELTARMRPTLERVLGPKGVIEAPRITGAEDFSYFAERVPGLFYFLGVRPPSIPQQEAIPNHSPLFYADEAALIHGMRTLAHLAADYLAGN